MRPSNDPLIEGFATAEGTHRFSSKMIEKGVRADFYKMVGPFTLSTLGLGSYLGNSDDTDDTKLAAAVTQSLQAGINVIDTASVYRDQRSERVIGQTLSRLIASGAVSRDEIFISTKGGFIPFDGKEPADPSGYFRDRFLKTRVLKPEEVAAGCHSLAPAFIEDQFEQSRQNLGLKALDLYFLHNPETQLAEISHDELIHRLHRAFQVLEKKIQAEQLGAFGTATWNAFRVPGKTKDFLDLNEVLDAASDHGASNGFRFIQLPYNVEMPEAFVSKNQGQYSTLEFCRTHGIHVFVSASIMQGQVLGNLPDPLKKMMPGAPDAVIALNFVRSTPGVDVALCGMKESSHVGENLMLAKNPPLEARGLEEAVLF